MPTSPQKETDMENKLYISKSVIPKGEEKSHLGFDELTFFIKNYKGDFYKYILNHSVEETIKYIKEQNEKNTFE